MCAGKDSERVEKARQHEDQLLQCHHARETSTLTICQCIFLNLLVIFINHTSFIFISYTWENSQRISRNMEKQ